MTKIIKIKGSRNIQISEQPEIKLTNQEIYFINTNYIYELMKFGNCTKVFLDANFIYSVVETYYYDYANHPYSVVKSANDFIITETPIEDLINLINS